MLIINIYTDKLTGISVSKTILEVERFVKDHIDIITDIGIVTLTLKQSHHKLSCKIKNRY